MAVVAVLAYLAVVHLAPLPTVVAGRLSQTAVTAVAAISGVLWCRSARWCTDRLRLGIGLLGTGMLSWSVAELIWLCYGWHTGGVGVPIPAVANGPFLVTMIGVPVSAVVMVRQFKAGLRTGLDGLLIGTSLLFVVWALVIGPAQRAGSTGLGSIGYAMADALIVSLTVLVLGNAHPSVRASLEISAVGMVVMFAADSTYAYLNIDAHYRFGDLPDLFWYAAFVVLAIATPRKAALRGLAELADRDPSRDFLPYAPFTLAVLTAVAVPVVQHRVDDSLYWFSIALALVVVSRQMITLAENRILTRRLSDAVHDLRFRADHDSLTGLGNRALFESRLDAALSADADSLVAVLYIDLDGFKPINDTYGHDAGDQALVAVAGRLRGTARQADLVARLGGDEFAILAVSDRTGPEPPGEVAAAMAGRILTALREPLDLAGRSASVGASIGIAQGRPTRTSPGELLRNADAAMYAAKRQGRNRLILFDPDVLPAPYPS